MCWFWRSWAFLWCINWRFLDDLRHEEPAKVQLPDKLLVECDEVIGEISIVRSFTIVDDAVLEDSREGQKVVMMVGSSTA